MLVSNAAEQQAAPSVAGFRVQGSGGVWGLGFKVVVGFGFRV